MFAASQRRDSQPQPKRRRIDSPAPSAFSHDADGNLLDNAEWNLTWDGENRLIAAETTFNAAAAGKPRQKLEFAYDHQSRRIQKKLYAWDDGMEDWVLTSDLRFIYDGWNLIAVLSSALSPQTSFLWGTDLSGSMQGAGGVGGLLAVSNHQSPIGSHFTAYDGNGNVVALTDASDGTETARYEYGPFGEMLRSTGPMAQVNPFRFSTKYQDIETGLLYYGYRYYDPSTGRWLSRDPIEELGGVNLYSHTRNRPTRLIDVLGLCCLKGQCEITLLGITNKQRLRVNIMNAGGQQLTSSFSELVEEIEELLKGQWEDVIIPDLIGDFMEKLGAAFNWSLSHQLHWSITYEATAEYALRKCKAHWFKANENGGRGMCIQLSLPPRKKIAASIGLL